ncbi:MAG: sugar phosphate nucleotidyltransferase, partial [Aquiluna sp.]
DPKPVPGDDSQALVSMGNYIFNAEALIDAIQRDGDNEGSSHDMGGDIIPAFVEAGTCGVYDFTFNEIPGATDRDKSYWRDVGTIDSYYEAHMDLISTMPIFNLYNSDWPVFNQQINMPPAKFIHDSEGNPGRTNDSITSLGVVVTGGIVER